MSQVRLFSYKLVHDSGFAPNPFWGVLTLATCKQCIRRSKKVGDWIAGFTSNELCGDEVGSEKLIYLMRVTTKISIADYFNDRKYKDKIPNNKSEKGWVGDNIYRPKISMPSSYRDYELIQNSSHDESNIEKDISGQYVLISNEFFYFGRNALEIPSKIRPSIPKSQHPSGHRTHDQLIAKEFIAYVTKKYKIGKHGQPHESTKNGNRLNISMPCSCDVSRGVKVNNCRCTD
jgi:hypothetical protein